MSEKEYTYYKIKAAHLEASSSMPVALPNLPVHLLHRQGLRKEEEKVRYGNDDRSLALFVRGNSLASNPDVRWYCKGGRNLRTEVNFSPRGDRTFSINLPIPVVVNALPPNICVASARKTSESDSENNNNFMVGNQAPSAVSRAVLDTNLQE